MLGKPWFLVLLAGAALPIAAQVRIGGRVVERTDGGAATPVPEAHVLAKAGSPVRTIAEAQTDSQGRYALTGLPVGRVILSVEAQGYYTLRAGELESSTIARACAEPGDCGETNFEAARAAVIEGWLTDSYGDPYQDILLELSAESTGDSNDPIERLRRAKHASSDDRGYFRMWDLRPGRYQLTLRQFGMGFRGGPPVEVEKRTIEIAPGQTRHETRITLKTDANVFSISGEVAGVASEGPERAGVSIQPAGDDDPMRWTRFDTLRDGKFTFSGLRKGEYVLRLAHFDADVRKWSYLEKLNVDRDLTGLQLTPQPPTGVRGRVEFVEAPPSNLYIGAGPPGKAEYTRDYLEAKAPDYAFLHEGLAPGEYELVLRGQDYYFLEPTRVTVARGQVLELVVRVSNQYASVRGVARLAEGESRQAAAHFTIGLRGERGRHTVRADDAGGFTFPKIIPGDYEIAAWEGPDVEIDDEELWRRAGENRKRLELEAGFETEIGLTVTR